MTPVARLAAAIAGELERPTPVGPDVVRFAETALGGADDPALLAVLADRDDPDRETLAELLLFPDAGMKAALEPLLAAVRLEPAQERAVAEALAGLAPEARYLLPGGAMVSLAPAAQALSCVVVRLRPADGAPHALACAVDDALPPEAALAARVRLRHARCPFTQRNTDLLLALARSPHTRPGLAEMLDFACGLLAALPEGADVSAAIALRHETARRHLEAQARHAEELERHNFETLALRGGRQPHADPAALRREMHLADRMSLALYGVRAASPVAIAEDLGTGDASTVLRLLDLEGPDA